LYATAAFSLWEGLKPLPAKFHLLPVSRRQARRPAKSAACVRISQANLFSPSREGSGGTMNTYKAILAFFSLLSFILISPALLQSQVSQSHLKGTLTDRTGAGISRARITAQAEGSTTPAGSAETDGEGSYSLALAPGRYRIVVSRDPFLTRESDVTLQAGETFTLNFSLQLAPMSASVVVTGQSLPITGPQTTAPTDVLTHQDIDNRQAVTIPELIQFSPGVVIGRTGAFGGTASLFLDGGNSGFTKVLVDGTPINPPGGAVDFSNITTDNIDKVEIVHGAESAMYGTDAVSGVVQLFTHRGDTRIPAASAYAEGGNFSSSRAGAQLSGLLGAFDYSGAASYFSTEGQGPNDDFINRTLSGNFGYSFSENNQIHVALRNNTSDAGIAGQTVFTPPSLYQRYNQQLFSANARWDFTSGQHWHYELAGTESYSHQHSFNPQQSFYATDPNAFCPQSNPIAVATPEFCDYIYDAQYTYNRAGVNAQATYVARQFSFTAGYQYEVENGYIYYLEQGHVRRNNQGGYLDLRYSPTGRLTLDAAARAEANDYFGTRVLPRVGGSYLLHYGKRFWGDTRYRAFFGEGIKEPRFDQTYGSDPCDPGNLSLRPESSKTFSTGIDQKLAGDRVKVSADYYYNKFYDIVSFQFCLPEEPCPGTPPPNCPFGYGSYYNTDSARAQGTHISSEARVTSWLVVMGNYTFDNSRILESPNATDPSLLPGNHLARRPVNSGSFTFVGTYHRFNATFAGYFSGQRTDSDFLGLGLTRDPGYSRFDLAASYNFIGGFSVYGRAINLFNESYQDALGYPALGRSVQVGLRYQFAGRN
jgi:vitamin B12 transporter